MTQPSRRRRFLLSVLVSLVVLALTPLPGEDPRPLNFVFFLVDDLGYMDVGCNNADTFYETPNIDRLARTGMRFTHGAFALEVKGDLYYRFDFVCRPFLRRDHVTPTHIGLHYGIVSLVMIC